VYIHTNQSPSLKPIQALKLPRQKLPLHIRIHVRIAAGLLPYCRCVFLHVHMSRVGHREPAGEDSVVRYRGDVGLVVVVGGCGVEEDACVGCCED